VNVTAQTMSGAPLAPAIAQPWGVILLIGLGVVGLAWFVATRQALLFVVGVGMGCLLAGARFGFTTGWRNLIEARDPSGVFAQLVLLAVAAALSIPLLAAFPGELTAALGPPSVSLLVGAFVFGLTMQIADGCGSGTLYKAGLGIPRNMAILPLFALGSFLGSVHLHGWLSLGASAPVSLMTRWGAGAALATTLAGLVVLGLLAWAWSRSASARHSPPWFDRKLLWAGIGLALLAVANLLIAGQPWGVVYGFGLWGAKIATALGLFDPAGNAFWGQAGNLHALEQTLFLDVTSITNIGMLAGALCIAARKPPRSAPLSQRQWLAVLAAGFVLGYSSRLAFGCNVGALVSGISTGSLHGWIWLALAFAGSLAGVRLRRRLGV